MSLEKIKEKYKNVPQQLKKMKRWVGYKVEGLENGKTTKRPYNALNGSLARVNDDLTWTTFNSALMGCVKYNFDGIGFILGNGIFGIDLDNHPDKDGNYEMTDDEFKVLSDEFISTLKSYAEYSQSGKGVHIICEGTLPEGSRRKKGSPVEMYENGRFFAFTGNVICNENINFREQEVIPLWEKYVKTEYNESSYKRIDVPKELKISDEEVIDIAINSRNGEKFYKYYHDGDISMDGNDDSSADMSFCMMLAFWCNGDMEQMDRIFRASALMREKWDKYRGKKTYGELTLEKACALTSHGFIQNKPIFTVKNKEVKEFPTELNLDENGEPIFRIKKIFKNYSYTDTGNAMKFYDYFGDLFKYNKTDKHFLFWTGKVWIKDTKDIIRKYANRFIDILKIEEDQLLEKKQQADKEGKSNEASDYDKMLTACRKNISRVANKAGKDAMLFELQSLYDVPIESSELDKDDFLLNTQSGIVNLKTGEISAFDKNKLMSQITKYEVSYDEPKVWNAFLKSIFDTGDEEQTQKLINCLRLCLGYSLTGSVKEQVMFLLYGGGSNGKSTLMEIISNVVQDYSDNVLSDVLLQKKGAGNSTNFSLAKLQKKRIVTTGETDEGGKFAEAHLKLLTGDDTIVAQYKYGNEFSYKPKFKIWMSTNNKPIIGGTDFGIWRRLVPFEFLKCFSDAQKDKDLPDKLKKEGPQILGWAILGAIDYIKCNNLQITQQQRLCLEKYKAQMDVVTQFILEECTVDDKSAVECKELYDKYKDWAKDNTEYTVKESKFRERLVNKGISVENNTAYGKKYYKGIRINGTFNIRNKEKGMF